MVRSGYDDVVHLHTCRGIYEVFPKGVLVVIGVVLYSLAALLLAVSVVRDRGKTAAAVKKAGMIFWNLLPEILAIMLFVGLSLAVLTPDVISALIGEESGVFGVLAATVVGAFALIPSFIVFPLGGTLIDAGAGYPQVAAFVASLMSIGLASLPMESKVFGRQFAVKRNLYAAAFALLFAAVIWGVF
ncbi:hypothetical protein BCL52_1255 [Salisediminibacterium halotolerans]|nr:hypothetical protein BCL39_1258 [Actinophytocola xinjiangensis]RPE89594.1 hypothetical protein EDD67_0371 [Salisediminibacterium halotolerans]TWG36353.1 hypothetical protein BCL52_1255 [Salisediminibacterium halotolerans]